MSALTQALRSRSDEQRRRVGVPPAVRAIVAANAVWIVDSLALLAFDWGSPTTAGAFWIVMQAAVVALFAGLQALGQRRAR